MKANGFLGGRLYVAREIGQIFIIGVFWANRHWKIDLMAVLTVTCRPSLESIFYWYELLVYASEVRFFLCFSEVFSFISSWVYGGSLYRSWLNLCPTMGKKYAWPSIGAPAVSCSRTLLSNKHERGALRVLEAEW